MNEDPARLRDERERREPFASASYPSCLSRASRCRPAQRSAFTCSLAAAALDSLFEHPEGMRFPRL